MYLTSAFEHHGKTKQSHTFAALIRLSTTTPNMFTTSSDVSILGRQLLYSPNPRCDWCVKVDPLLFSNGGVSSFTSHKNQITGSAVRRDPRFFVLIQEDLFADVITKSALSSQLFKDCECWSGQGSSPRPPAQQTRALQTELTRRWLERRRILSTAFLHKSLTTTQSRKDAT